MLLPNMNASGIAWRGGVVVVGYGKIGGCCVGAAWYLPLICSDGVC